MVMFLKRISWGNLSFAWLERKTFGKFWWANTTWCARSGHKAHASSWVQTLWQTRLVSFTNKNERWEVKHLLIHRWIRAKVVNVHPFEFCHLLRSLLKHSVMLRWRRISPACNMSSKAKWLSGAQNRDLLMSMPPQRHSPFVLRYRCFWGWMQRTPRWITFPKHFSNSQTTCSPFPLMYLSVAFVKWVAYSDSPKFKSTETVKLYTVICLT